MAVFESVAALQASWRCQVLLRLGQTGQVPQILYSPHTSTIQASSQASTANKHPTLCKALQLAFDPPPSVLGGKD